MVLCGIQTAHVLTDANDYITSKTIILTFKIAGGPNVKLNQHVISGGRLSDSVMDVGRERLFRYVYSSIVENIIF